MVEVSLCGARLSVGMDFTVGANGDGHFNHAIKDLIGLVRIDKVMGNSEDGIVSDHNP